MECEVRSEKCGSVKFGSVKEAVRSEKCEMWRCEV